MRRHLGIAALLAVSCLLCGCSDDMEDWLATTEQAADFTYEDGANVSEDAGGAESADLQYGTGLEEISVTGEPDADPDRKIVMSRAPIRQVRGVSINGSKLSDDFYFYRSMLSTQQKKAYDQIYSAIYKGCDTVTMSVPVHYGDLESIIYSISYDHPELFWAESAFTYYYNGSGEVTSVTVSFNSTANGLSDHQRAFESAVSKVLTKANTFSTDIEKVKYVHDYLTNINNYVSGSPLNQSAYSALVLGKTVCAGYARAFQYCMQKLEIPTAFVVGYAGEAHAWNLIKLDGEYYNMDVTWDDPIGNPATTYYYDYFNITDSEISRNHTRRELSLGLPAANGTKYSYKSWFGGNSPGSDFSDWASIIGNVASEYGDNATESKTDWSDIDWKDTDPDEINWNEIDWGDLSETADYADEGNDDNWYDDDWFDALDWDIFDWEDEDEYPDDYFYDYDDFSDWWGTEESLFDWGFGNDFWD